MKASRIMNSILLFLMVIFIFHKDSQETLSVFQEQKAPTGYFLEVSKENFTSNNVDQIASKYGLTIRKIYPFYQLSILDEQIAKELKSFYYYNEMDVNQKYYKVLKKYGLYNDMERFLIDKGFKIKGLVAIGTISSLEELQHNYPNIRRLDSEMALVEM